MRRPTLVGFLVAVVLYGSEKMIWRVKERSRVRAVQMDNLRSLLGIRRMDRVPSVWIRELCRVDERFDKSILHWFGLIERM